MIRARGAPAIHYHQGTCGFSLPRVGRAALAALAATIPVSPLARFGRRAPSVIPGGIVSNKIRIQGVHREEDHLHPAGVGAGGVVAIAALVSLIDPNQFKPQLVEQVRKSTGRELVMEGRSAGVSGQASASPSSRWRCATPPALPSPTWCVSRAGGLGGPVAAALPQA